LSSVRGAFARPDVMSGRIRARAGQWHGRCDPDVASACEAGSRIRRPSLIAGRQRPRCRGRRDHGTSSKRWAIGREVPCPVPRLVSTEC